jgi:hypothetical protein
MLKFARTAYEIADQHSILCGLTLPFGPGVSMSEAVEALSVVIFRNADWVDSPWALELARTALRDFQFPFTHTSEITLFLYET